MWIDSHAHLYDLSDFELQDQLKEACDLSVCCILNTAANLSSALIIARQCSFYKGMFGAAGITPFDIHNQPPDWPLQLRILLDNPSFIAVGETGLDESNPRYPPVAEQLPFLQNQLETARERDLPIVLHSRGAEELVLDICKEQCTPAALFHCFTGSIAAARQILDKGYYISLSGIITFKNSGMDELVGFIPADRLLIETDAPYLAPVPHRGQRNRPALVKITGEYAARIRGVSPDQLQAELQQNFTRLFKKPL